ncbi:thioredoxin [Candidatus Xianfuyuplasma coldseepsis]|uniref:Thioredoxin n=1 Tax=Candidatus Xianfuyuplasma coldseepsis TaxID=2782163 RepID=A0A7L7KS05_9MOLU|nr:thioredoxin [Xianfuyuplasma coldseepsis]QMS84734.1 thioredoxin [Xianfuyuplasma coldseepsis]
MKRLLIFVSSAIAIVLLSSCKQEELDYSDFEDNIIATYFQAETLSNNRYILYYYDSTDDASNTIKNDVLTFIESYNDLPLYMVDASANPNVTSDFGAYVDEPIVYVVSHHEPLETYTGSDEITTFISSYSSKEWTYDAFDNQHLSNINDALTINNSDYLLYVYDPSDEQAMSLQEAFLKFAFTKSIEDIYLIDHTTIETIPDELDTISMGNPMILLMSYGVYAEEYYLGSDEITQYMNIVGDGDIYTSLNTLDYDDFIDHHLTNFGDTLTITDDLHLEYYYSPYCSHCNSIKTKMLSFLYYLDTVPYYLINTSSAVGLVKIDDFMGTPSLYVIYNGEVVESYIGSVQVPNFIDDYRQGIIDFSTYQ